jgi:hypothetical protein
VPAALLVLVGDVRGISGNDLLFRRTLRRSAGLFVGREGLGIDPIDPIRPTAVMFDVLLIGRS